MIMKNAIKLFVIAGVLFGLSSCAMVPPLKTNVMVNKNNTFTMMAISNSEPNALNGGIAAATEYCKNKNKYPKLFCVNSSKIKFFIKRIRGSSIHPHHYRNRALKKFT